LWIAVRVDDYNFDVFKTRLSRVLFSVAVCVFEDHSLDYTKDLVAIFICGSTSSWDPNGVRVISCSLLEPIGQRIFVNLNLSSPAWDNDRIFSVYVGGYSY
jgi:hypothetical protein